ncbi:uncharacterized protein LOC135388185 isoform X2 [Ornithodoros turicata]|uniref:uncharacterized protein LOC135388185 isoform X2 n=1 Tax=Ornithodoros turicata TaxID=34597 RepID=UPI0031395A48
MDIKALLGLLLVGLAALAHADDEKAKATEDLGMGYVMAFPMEDSKQSESPDSNAPSSTPAPVEKAETPEPSSTESSDERNVEAVIVETPSGSERPKADDIRKLLGVYNAALSAKLKPIPPEKQKQFLFPPPRKQQNYGPSGGIAFASAVEDDDVRYIEVPGPESAFMHRSLVVEDDNDVQDNNEKKDKDDEDYDNEQVILAVPARNEEPKSSEAPMRPRPPMGMPLFRPPMPKMPFRPPMSPMVLMLVAKVPVPVPVPSMRIPHPGMVPQFGMLPPSPFPDRRMAMPHPMMSAAQPVLVLRPLPPPMPNFFPPHFPHPPMYGPAPVPEMMPYPAAGMLPPPAYMMPPPPMHPMMRHPAMFPPPMHPMMRHPAMFPPPMHPMMRHPAMFPPPPPMHPMMHPHPFAPYPMPSMVPPQALLPPPMPRGPIGVIIPVPMGVVLPHPGMMPPPRADAPVQSYRSRGPPPPPSPFLFNGPPGPRPFPVQRPAEPRMMPMRRPFMFPMGPEDRSPVERFPPPPPPPPPFMPQRGPGMVPVLMRSSDAPGRAPMPIRMPVPIESQNQQEPVLLKRPPPPQARAVEAIMGPVHNPVPMAEVIRRQARLVLNAPPQERLGVSYMGPKATPRVGGSDVNPASTLETASTILRFLLRAQGA